MKKQNTEHKTREKNSTQDTELSTQNTELETQNSKLKTQEYAFPTKSRCPRCKALETTAYATKGNVQYRRCLRAVCRWNYQVIGTKI